MGQLYASREILFNCKIFLVQWLWSSRWEEWVEVNWVIRWNVKITRWNWSRTTAGTLLLQLELLYIFIFTLLSCSQLQYTSVSPVVSHLLFGVLWYWWRGLCHFNDSNIPGRMKFKTTADGKMWNRKFKSNFLVGQRNKQKQLQSRAIFSLFDRHQPYICPSSIGW